MNKKILRYIAIYFLASTALGLIVLLVIFMIYNPIGNVNRAARAAREAYINAHYTDAFLNLKYLEDSLKMESDAIKLNLAHTAFLVGKHDSSANTITNILKGVQADSSTKSNVTIASYLQYYNDLAGASSDGIIASIAFNQMGVTTARLQSLQNEDSLDTALKEAAEYFKSAVKKDPFNDDARYNYELVRKRLEYPRVVMGQVKALIDQHKYREAYNALQEAMDKDAQLAKNYQEYLKRLETIVKINHE